MPAIYQQDFTHVTDNPEGGSLETDISIFYTYTPAFPGRGPSYYDGGIPPEDAEVEIQSVLTEDGVEFALSDDWMLHYSDRILEGHNP